MTFSSPRRKSQAPLPADRRPRLRAWRPLVEPMEDRVVLTAASATVTQLYQDLLHRLPDGGGLAYWTGQLDQGAPTQAVASALTHSTEYHQGEVDGVYQRLLSRPADQGGRAFFAAALDRGQTIQQVEAAVASSPEYAQAHSGASGFLDALFNGSDHLKTLVSGAYEQVLHRTGDAGGLAYWAGRMADGASLGDVTATLAASPEWAARPASTATVLGTFGDASSLPLGGVGGLETSLAGAAHAALGAGAGALPQAVTKKVGPPAVFQAFGPQRLVDTRNGVSGQYGGPAFVVGGTRTINVAPYNLADPSIPSAAIGDQPPTSNLPANVTAVSVILFIVGAPQAEYFTAYATGTSPAPTATATVFADRVGQIIAASAIVPVNASGNIDIYSSGGGNLIIDITGYFLDQLDGTDQLRIIANDPGQAAILGQNNSTSAGSHALGGFVNGTGPVHGVQGQAGTSAGSGSSGVHGINDSTTAAVDGVLGEITATSPGGNSAGVRGINNGTGGFGIGVFGSQNGSGFGVEGTVTGAGFGGVFSAGTNGIGVSASGGFLGISASAFDTAGAVYGVRGSVSSGAVTNSAGVRGIGPTGGSAGLPGLSAGVLGQGSGSEIPVIGIGNFEGVRGINTNGDTSTVATFGSLGFSDTTAGFFSGNTIATGTKSFVDPSPTDPTKVIKYATLEGPEVGTYFRGTSHFTNGVATIDVPDIFRSETESNGLSIQVTPVGQFANVAVKSIDLNHIVVLGTADVDFFYTVNGIRLGYANFQPIQEQEREFLPLGPNAKMPTSLNAVQRQRLIDTGIYHADGTVNLTTAHNLGWDRLWAATTTTSSGSGAATS